MKRLTILLAFTALFALVSGVEADSGPTATLGERGVTMEDDGGGVKLAVDLTRPVGWRLWLADGPPRLVLELSDFAWNASPELRSTSLVAFQLVETGPHMSELHLVLREPLGVVSAEMKAADDGTAFLDVRLQPTTADAFQADLEALQAEVEAAEERLVVAIDPGHGGTDPGAQAVEIREADLVLAFARRLRDILVASGRFDVVLTREDDSFLSLDARLTVARSAGADILLSLHADALEGDEQASGLVLYRLDPAAGAEANERLTERHSPDDRLNGIDLTGAGQDVNLALLELARRDAIPRTRALSAAFLDAFEGADLVVNSRPQRTGDFAVLKAADIPSLLIELGFLSTEADLHRLISDDWQTRVAMAIRDGLSLWVEEDRLR